MFIESESRREKRRYKNYYKKISHQRSYIAQVGRWLGYSWDDMKKRWIYPGVSKGGFGTCQVRYRSGRYWIDQIPYTWDTGELLRELLRLRVVIEDCPDVMYKAEARKWLKKKVFSARILHYRGMVKKFLLSVIRIGK